MNPNFKSLKYLLAGSLALVVILGCNFGSDVVENSNTGLNENSSLNDNSGLNDNSSLNDNIDDILSTSVPAGSSLTVTNNSGRTLCEVYVSPDGATEWGEDRLGAEALDPGESQTITVADGLYQARAEDCNNDLVAEEIELEVSGSTTWEVELRTVGDALAAGGEAGTLTVVNNTSDSVCYVYVSATDATSWGTDWLGADTILDDGDEQTITVGVGTYDLQAADCDGNAIAEQYEIDFSTGQTWTLGE
jgi:hypothetical protein